eukprot:g20369.t1
MLKASNEFFSQFATMTRKDWQNEARRFAQRWKSHRGGQQYTLHEHLNDWDAAKFERIGSSITIGNDVAGLVATNTLGLP